MASGWEKTESEITWEPDSLDMLLDVKRRVLQRGCTACRAEDAKEKEEPEGKAEAWKRRWGAGESNRRDGNGSGGPGSHV